MIPQTIDQYQCGEFDLVRNRFHVAMGLYRGRSQLTSKCGKKKVIHFYTSPRQHGIYFALYDRQGKYC